MKVEIISVTHKEYDEIITNEPMKYYRRHSLSHWEHKLGVYGWQRLIDARLYEGEYQAWLRKKRKAKKKKENTK